MRKHLAELRGNYPARSTEENVLLREYRNKIQEFGRELLKPLDRIDHGKLNDLTEESMKTFLAYVAIWRRR